MKFIEIAGVVKEIVLKALESKFSDFEDAIQNECAVKLEIDIIITRNKKDFIESKIEVLSPVEFLEKLESH